MLHRKQQTLQAMSAVLIFAYHILYFKKYRKFYKAFFLRIMGYVRFIFVNQLRYLGI